MFVNNIIIYQNRNPTNYVQFDFQMGALSELKFLKRFFLQKCRNVVALLGYVSKNNTFVASCF